jgi:hypothetical protein
LSTSDEVAITNLRRRDAELIDAKWDYTLVDLVGDVSQHVRFDVKAVSR